MPSLSVFHPCFIRGYAKRRGGAWRENRLPHEVRWRSTRPLNFMKRLCALACSLSAAVVASAAVGDFQPPRGNYNFPIYTNQPPGKQITSGQLPATTHALSPEETRHRIEVP